MTAALTIPPAVEPVTLAEAKAHMRVAETDDDLLVGAMITAARSHVEALTRRVMIDQGWRLYRDEWPAGGVLQVPIGPLKTVAAITVYDAAGAPTVVPPATYTVDIVAAPGRIALKSGVIAPGAALNGIEIDFTAGYGPSGIAVPQPLRQAIMMLVAHWYENRAHTVIGAIPTPIAAGFEALIAPYRMMRLA